MADRKQGDGGAEEGGVDRRADTRDARRRSGMCGKGNAARDDHGIRGRGRRHRTFLGRSLGPTA